MSLTRPDLLPPPSPAPLAAAPEVHGHESGLRPEDLLRLVVVGLLVIGGGLALGAFTFQQLQTRGTGYFVVALCLGVILTALAYWRFQPTIALYTGLIWITIGGTPSLANGVSSGTGKGLYPVELGTLALLVIWGLRGLGRGRFPLVKTPINGWLAVYLLFSLWTAVNGWLFWDPALAHFYAGLPGGGKTPVPVVALELLQRVLSVGIFWLLASNLTNEKWLRRASLFMLVPGVMVLLAHLHFVPNLSNVYDTLLTIPVGCALWAWLLENPQRTPARRAVAFAVLGLLIFQVFFVQLRWISGWMGLFIGLFFVAWLKSRRLFAGLLCVAVLLAVLAHPFLQANVVHKVETTGDMDRFSMQRAALMYALRFPLGIGPGNFRAYNMYYGSPSMWNTTGYTSAHNFYGQALTEMGFVGLFLTLAWVVTALVMLTRFYRRSPPGWSRTMIMALGGMWAGISCASYLGDYLIPVYHNGGLANMGTTIYAWIGLGIAVAYARANGSLESPATSVTPHAPTAGGAISVEPPRRSAL